MVMFPPFRLDREEERLWKGDSVVTLRRKPLAILRYLVDHPKKLVTHDELLANVWQGTVVSESAVRSHMHELRQVLGDGVIETVIGRGYRFVAELRDDVVVHAAPVVAQVDPLVVGRDAELAVLDAALARARGGRRQICFVTGDPGIGKSTLVRTFLARLDTRTLTIARGHCFEQHGTPEAYLAVIEAFGGLGRSARGAQTVATLVRYAPTFVCHVPHLVSDEQLADAMRRAAGANESRMLRELSEAIEVMCSEEPTVIVLEDLQWSDLATIDLLSMLGQRQERAKLLVIATSRYAEIQRPEHPLNPVMRSLVARYGAAAVRLPAIDLAAVQSFIDRRFAGHAFPPRLTQLVAKITGGTPLFVVSLLDELASRGMLAERDGQWSLTVSIEDVEAHRPASVKQLIDMQLDRLPAEQQRVLEAASVVGAEFSTTLVATALGLPVEDIDDTCDTLLRQHLFLRAAPGDLYGVTHALVQEVCYERSSPARRQRWHRLVAEALDRSPRASEWSHLRAKHFDAAGDPERAIPAYVAAGRLAGQRFAAADALALCGRALDLLPRLAAGRERDQLELQIIETMCKQVSSNNLRTTFGAREPLAAYTRAVEIARSLGDPGSLYAAVTQLCNFYMITAQYDRTAVLTSELEQLELAHAIEPARLHAGTFARAYIAFFTADFATSLRLFERLCTDPAHRDNLVGKAIALGHLACARWIVGDPDGALADAFATIELADKINVPIVQALGHVVRGRMRFLRRDPLSIVEAEAPDAVRLATVDLGLLTEARALALWAEAQRTPLALHAVEPMLDSMRQRLEEVSTCSTLVAQMLIAALRISGHVTAARDLTDQIIAFARAHDESAYLPELLRIRGEQREATDRAGALDDYRDAVELARSTGSVSLEQRATASLAALVAREP